MMPFGNMSRLAHALTAQSAAILNLLKAIAAECRETGGNGPGFEKLGARCKTCDNFTNGECVLRKRRHG